MFSILIVCCVIVCASAQQPEPPSEAVRVTSNNGVIVGRHEPVPGFQDYVQVFRGIPYARPPTGVRRLKPPEFEAPSITEVNATAYKPSCPQPHSQLKQKYSEEVIRAGMDEDCLYLNIWRPQVIEQPIPVMIWIHGGAFTDGTGSSFDSRYLVTLGKVIVITINYRLGVLGFLPTGGTEGTLGLQDQVMAIKWVSTMIDAFGGDPRQITLFGQSAGAASISLLSRVKLAGLSNIEGLFHRVICQSGVASSPWSIVRAEEMESKMNQVKTYFEKNGCFNGALECMKTATVNQTVELTQAMAITPPAVDNEYVKADWNDVRNTHKGLEIMIGSTPQEAAYFIHSLCTNWYTSECDQFKGISQDELMSPYLALGMTSDNVKAMIERYNQLYPMPAQTGNVNSLAAGYLITDHQIHVPSNQTASDLIKAGYNVRVYLFDLVGTQRLYTAVPWTTDAHHGDEISFVFAQRTGKEQEEELTQQVKVVKLWTDFAEGKPAANWLPFTYQHGEYLHITKEKPEGVSAEPYLAKPISDFWRSYWKYGIFPSDDNMISKAPQLISTAVLVIVATLLQFLIIR